MLGLLKDHFLSKMSERHLASFSSILKFLLFFQHDLPAQIAFFLAADGKRKQNLHQDEMQLIF